MNSGNEQGTDPETARGTGRGEIQDANGKRPLEDLLSESAELKRLYEEGFTKLPAIERLTEQWANREGVSPSDPIFITSEMLGLFEIRQRAGMRGLVDILRQQDEVIATLISELEERMAEVATMSETAAQLRLVIDDLRAEQKRLVDINGQFLEVIPDVMEGIHGAAKLINDKTVKSMLLTWAGMVSAMAGGVLIGLMVARWIV